VTLVTNRRFSYPEIRLHYSKLKRKIVGLMLFAAMVAAPAAVRAQEATDAGLQPAPTSQKPRPVATPGASLSELSQVDAAFKQTSLGKDADEIRLRVKSRELANRVTNDPEVVAAKKSAAAARTDLEKREQLRLFYKIYYGKMRALASSDELKAYIDRIKQEHLALLSQARVRPSANETPTPFPVKKHHKK
jgi:hypothetical protein